MYVPAEKTIHNLDPRVVSRFRAYAPADRHIYTMEKKVPFIHWTCGGFRKTPNTDPQIVGTPSDEEPKRYPLIS